MLRFSWWRWIMLPENFGCEICLSICGFYLQCKSCVLFGFVSKQSLNLFRGLNWSFMLKKRDPSKRFTLPRSVLNFVCIFVCVHVRAEDLDWTKLDCKPVSSQVPSSCMHVVSKLLAVICSRVHPILASRTGKMVTCSSIANYSKMVL
jgi:hypothetical protein